MNREERKKWLEDRKDEIYKHCENAVLIDDKDYVESLSKEEVLEYIQKTYDVAMNEYKNELSNCLQNVNGIDITSYLDMIRNNDYETMICLLIKNNEIVDVIIEKGQYSGCNIGHLTITHAFEKAKKLMAEVYVVHNHPYGVAAVPSGHYKRFIDGFETWTGDQYTIHEEIPNNENKYGVKCIDYGIVTQLDYYSLNQKRLV